MSTNKFKSVIEKLIEFRNERDWKQFHNAKDLSLALSIEASELLELFLWKSAEAADPNKVKSELADILSYSLLLCEKYDFDPNQIVLDKLKENAIKYPINKSKGVSTKYTEL